MIDHPPPQATERPMCPSVCGVSSRVSVQAVTSDCVHLPLWPCCAPECQPGACST